MIDHLGITVGDFAKSKAFYDAAMPAIGATLVMQVTAEQTGGAVHAGYGRNGKPDFWIGTGSAPGGHVHIAFSAPNRAMVDAFHGAALAAGGRDNGTPGLRPHYHPNYYGAFIFDPDGNNIEAVCHLPE